MKRFVQFAAVLLAACLAVPPAMAGVVCQALAASMATPRANCCSGANHGAMAHAHCSEPGHSMRSSACGADCCTMAPQSPATPAAFERACVDAATVVPLAALAVLPQNDSCDAAVTAAPDSPSIPRYVLLRTFRI